jgi:hypothetical protein
MLNEIKKYWTGNFIELILGSIGVAAFIAAITIFIFIIEVLR